MKNIQFKQNGRFFYGWIIVLMGLLLMMFAYVSFVSLTSVFVLPVTEGLGIKRGDWVAYMVILSLSCVVCSPFLGKFINKGKAKYFIAGACLLGFLGYWGFSRANSVTDFYLWAIVLGIGFAGTAPMPVSIIINKWFGGKIRGTATGFTFIGSGIGGVLLSPSLNAVIMEHGWRAGYLALGAVYLVLMLITLILVNDNPQVKGFVRMGEDEAEKKVAVDHGNSKNLAEAMRTPEFYFAVASTVLVVLASSAIAANDVSWYVECGIDQTRAASLHGILLGMLIIGKPVMGVVTDKLGIKVSSVLSTVIFAATFAMLLMMPSAATKIVWLVILCYGFGGPTITVIPPLMVNGLFGDKDYGTLVGVMNMSTSIGGAFGGTIAAKVFDLTGSYSSFWLVACIAVLCAALCRFIAFRICGRDS